MSLVDIVEEEGTRSDLNRKERKEGCVRGLSDQAAS